MDKEHLEEANLTTVDFETQEETNLQFSTTPDEIERDFMTSFVLFIFVLILLYISPYIVPFLFAGSLDIYDDLVFDPKMFNNLKINLTIPERSEISKEMQIICDVLTTPQTTVKYFKPLFNKKLISKSHSSLIPLNKISFLISSSPSSSYLCKLYLDIWSTKYGSNLVKDTGIQPLKTVYWEYEDMHPTNLSEVKFTNVDNYNQFTNYKITLINETDSHDKLSFMLAQNLKHVPSDVEWFVIMDDNTLPFLDRIASMLSKYDNPLKNPYLIHSPGDKTKKHARNSGSGYYLSRKLVETIVPKLKQCDERLDNDARLDKCIRSITDISPIIDHGIFHMDPKILKGNLTGFIEGYVDRYNLKAIHNIEEYYLFPEKFLKMMKENDLYNVKTVNPKSGSVLNLSFDSFPTSGNNFFSQAAHFANSAAVSGDMFLKRYIIMINKNERYFCGILNFGYSLIVFDIEYKQVRYMDLARELLKYLSGVEQTFEVISDALYDNLTRLLVPECKKVMRYYLKRTIIDKFGFDSYWQEFCGVSSPATIAKIYVDNRKVSLDYLDYSIFRF